MSAWADLYDARTRLAHLLVAQGLGPEEVAAKLSVDEVDLQLILRSESEPPMPGSSRWMSQALRQRVLDLEAALRASRLKEAPAEPREPTTDIRALCRDPLEPAS